MRDPWQVWAHDGLGARLLRPLGALYCAIVSARRGLYALGVRRRYWLPAPVIVVGNITVGGTGKTPLAVWLCELLVAAGMAPGVVLRGYGGRGRGVLAVSATSDVVVVGDEAVLLARRTGRPVVAARDRVAGAQALIAAGCDVVIADDGLQHYRLGRVLEIGTLDGARRFGNGRCLPAGPLREPVGRWQELDFRVTQGRAGPGEWAMTLTGSQACAVGSAETAPLAAFTRVHAVAGIGNPGRFFRDLEGRGLEVVAHPFPDHYNYRAADLAFDPPWPVIMTEKDAVKCAGFARPDWWYVPVSASVDPDLGRRIVARLRAGHRP